MSKNANILAKKLGAAGALEQARIVCEYASADERRRRRAIAEVLATGAGELGVRTAIEALARDEHDDVRAAAVRAAVARMVRPNGPYARVVRRAGADPSLRVRTAARPPFSD